MAHHDHNHRNHHRRLHVPMRNALTHELRQRGELDANNTAPQNISAIGLWTLAMTAQGHLTATYALTGDEMVLAQAPVAPPPSTVRVPYATAPRAPGEGQSSPALLALIGGLPTSLPQG